MALRKGFSAPLCNTATDTYAQQDLNSRLSAPTCPRMVYTLSPARCNAAIDAYAQQGLNSRSSAAAVATDGHTCWLNPAYPCMTGLTRALMEQTMKTGTDHDLIPTRALSSISQSTNAWYRHAMQDMNTRDDIVPMQAINTRTNNDLIFTRALSNINQSTNAWCQHAMQDIGADMNTRDDIVPMQAINTRTNNDLIPTRALTRTNNDLIFTRALSNINQSTNMAAMQAISNDLSQHAQTAYGEYARALQQDLIVSHIKKNLVTHCCLPNTPVEPFLCEFLKAHNGCGAYAKGIKGTIKIMKSTAFKQNKKQIRILTKKVDMFPRKE